MEYNLSGGALTDALAFVPKSPATASRGYRTIINPINAGSQQPGSIVKFDVPVGKAATFIDTSETYIMFSVTNSGTAPITLDGSAYCFFSRADTLSMGAVLESIQSYNALATALLDVQMGGGTSTTSGTIHLGTGYSTSQFAAATSGGATTAATPQDAANFSKAGVTIPNGSSQDFAVPLALCGVLGSGLQKYLPIQKVSDLRLELTLEDAAKAVVSSATANFSINNPQLVLTYVEIDGVMAKQMDEAVGGRYILSSESWRNYTTILGSDGSSRSGDSILIPARYSSARTFLHLWRDNINQNNQAKYWLSARSNPFSSTSGGTCSIQYQCGSTLIPQQPLRYGMSECFMNAQEAFHQLGAVTNPTRCYYTNWGQPNYYDGNNYDMGTFVLAQNLDSFQNKSATMTCGLNTIQVPTFLNVTYATPPTAQQRVDSYVCFDMVLEVNDNGLSARY